MVKSILALVAGACALHFGAPLPPRASLPGVMLAAVGIAWRAPVVAAFAAGYALAAFSAHAVLADRLPMTRHGADVSVTGVVASLPDRRQRGARFQFRPDRSLHPDLPRELRVAWHLDAPPPEAGTRWRLTLRLRMPRGSLNPAAFDYEQWLAARRIGATAAVREHPAPVPLAGRGGGPVLHARAHVDRALGTALGDHARRGIIRGLSVGERGELDHSEWEVFARTGTAHLMAISGLHVGMVAGLVFALVQRVVRRLPVLSDRAREAAVLLGLLAAASYAALAGFAVPTRRALWMLAAGAVLLCARRSGIAFGAWAVALGAVVCTDPLSPLTIGFWLSFAAVAFIAWRVSCRRAAPRALVQLARVQWAVGVGLLPFTLWFFQRGSIVAPVANLVAVPAFTVAVVPATLGGALLAAVGAPVATPWLAAVGGLLDALWTGLETLAAWPSAQRFTPRPPLSLVAGAVAGALLLLMPRGMPARLTLGGALCLPMLVWQPAPPAEGGWRLSVLDVGQGLATVVRTRQHVLVYDAGPSYGPYADAGSRVVVPYLRAQGIRAVDLLMVSHPHDDHQGGAAALRAAVPVRRVLAGDPGPLAPPAERCVAGMRWEWDGVVFRVLHPATTVTHDPNLDSCVLEIDSVAGRALLPGDVEWQTELLLARPGGGLQPVDVVVAPHHGSRTSSTPRFVARTIPRHVVFAAAHANRWQFPHDEVVARWRSVGAEIHVTGTDGAVTVDADPARGIAGIAAERGRRHAWWRVE